MISKTKLHYELFQGEKLPWDKSGPYTYCLEWPTGSELELQASVILGQTKLELGPATTIDHLIWDEMIFQETGYNSCQALTILTQDVRFEILLLAKNGIFDKLRCMYLPPWDPKKCSVNLTYLMLPFPYNNQNHKIRGVRKALINQTKDKEEWNTFSGAFEVFVQKTANKSINIIDLISYLINETKKASKEDKTLQSILHIENEVENYSKDYIKDFFDSINNIRDGIFHFSTKFGNLIPKMVLWNSFVRLKENLESGSIKFRRKHAFAVDVFREKLQTLPIPEKFMQKKYLELKHEDDCDRLYQSLLQSYSFYVACGVPMQRNLLNLASLLNDKNVEAALVTGEPGTGKEAFSKALYYGRKFKEPENLEPEKVFISTTARDIQNKIRSGDASNVSSYLRKLINWNQGLQGGTERRAKSPVIFIDELNKADSGFLAEMLRPLEQGEDELCTDGKPKFILAASQHIEDLAKKKPQDFWTRISHQLRVVHPLSRVSEKDAEAFLSALFYAEWWKHVEKMLNNRKYPKRLVKAFVGHVDKKFNFKDSGLCELVRQEFLNTLVPLVERDTLTLRGLRSILNQIFARISWYVQFQKPMKKGPGGIEQTNKIARLVNSAVQDVLAILNPARATPAGMEDA